MDILYLLIPLSVVLVFLIIAMFWWALYSGQFDNIEREGERILLDDRTLSEVTGPVPAAAVDSHQVSQNSRVE